MDFFLFLFSPFFWGEGGVLLILFKTTKGWEQLKILVIFTSKTGGGGQLLTFIGCFNRGPANY